MLTASLLLSLHRWMFKLFGRSGSQLGIQPDFLGSRIAEMFHELRILIKHTQHAFRHGSAVDHHRKGCARFWYISWGSCVFMVSHFCQVRLKWSHAAWYLLLAVVAHCNSAASLKIPFVVLAQGPCDTHQTCCPLGAGRFRPVHPMGQPGDAASCCWHSLRLGAGIVVLGLALGDGHV